MKIPYSFKTDEYISLKRDMSELHYYFERHLGFSPLQPFKAKTGLANIKILIQRVFLALS